MGILPKLFKALGKNTHLRDLLLGNTGLRFSEVDGAAFRQQKPREWIQPKPAPEAKGGDFYVRRQESGTVNSWNVERQFGFISCDGNRSDVFLHAEGFRDVDVRDRVKKNGLKRPVLIAQMDGSLSRADDSESGGVGNSDPCANLADLSASLRSNSTLRRLDLQANYLEPHDLKVIFQSITPNSALQDLRVNFQASLAAPPVDFAQMMLSEAGTEIYKAAHKALEENKKLLKLDLILVQRHWRDQICRGLMKNLEEKRKDGREACLPQKVSCPSTA
eukprot:s1136_g2.t2